MGGRAKGLFPWLAGLFGIGFVLWVVEDIEFGDILSSLGVAGLAAWVALTVAARIVQAWITVAPLRVFGLSLSLRQAFWIGWIKTFANQVLPLAGSVAYGQAIRTQVPIAWSELAALVVPQFLLAAVAMGALGIVATLLNIAPLGGYWSLLGAAYCLVLIGSILMTTRSRALVSLLPRTLSSKLATSVDAVDRLAIRPRLLTMLCLAHLLAIALRGAKLAVIFFLAGVDLSWPEALLVVALAESTLLVQLTPGGLGLREGAVFAGAALVGIGPEVAFGVALVDRFLVLAVTSLFVVPATLSLRGSRIGGEHGRAGLS